MICKCPGAASLPTIHEFVCPESFGQIQKVAFQRLRGSDGSKNYFPGTDISDLENWNVFLSADDDSKIVMSPYIQNPETTPGGPRTFGGGNETLGGIEEIVGAEPTAFTGVIRKAPQRIIKALKQLACENVGVYLFDENGAIGAIDVTVEETRGFGPIPIRSFFVGDKALGGYDEPDSNAIQWNFLPNWSDDLNKLYGNDFNPLSDLREPYMYFNSFEAYVEKVNELSAMSDGDADLYELVMDLGLMHEMDNMKLNAGDIMFSLGKNEPINFSLFTLTEEFNAVAKKLKVFIYAI